MKEGVYNNSSVRRQDRLLDEQIGETLLREGEYGFLAMVEDRLGEMAGYGIPLNYVWDGDSAIYIHCAPTGHKLSCLVQHPLVSFSIVGKTAVISNKFTTAYQSIIVRGRICIGLSVEERMEALKLIILKYSPADVEVGLKYAEKSFHRTEILRIQIESISGKNKIIS